MVATNRNAAVTEAQKWQAALARAIDSGIDPYKLAGNSGVWAVPSASAADVAYATTSTSCTCPAGQRGMVCKHVALVRFLEGLLDDETPEEDDDSTDDDDTDPTDPIATAAVARGRLGDLAPQVREAVAAHVPGLARRAAVTTDSDLQRAYVEAERRWMMVCSRQDETSFYWLARMVTIGAACDRRGVDRFAGRRLAA